MKTRLALTLRWLRALALTLTALVWTGGAQAQLPPPGTPSQFDITGFLQEATLDPACTTGALCGGTLTVNGHVVTVPANTIVILPANALTWQELFAEAPAPYTGAATGMALADLPAPLTTYEVHVTGNRVNDSYIAGLVSVSQQALNSGQGYVTGIDYANGELQILNPSDGSNLRVRINDPIPAGQTTGKFSKGSSPDVRFTIDEDNPTIRSTTGFPMCLPRVAPPAVDELCPQGNRPIDAATGAFAASFTMPDPATIPTHGLPDPRIQAPFEIGDYVTFAGTLVTDNAAAPTAGPYPGTAATYISAHTITNNIAIYTWPNTNPAYVAIDVTILGTGGTTAIGATEAAVRTRFEGFSTDPSRIVHLYGIDLSCADGTVLDNRDWGTIDVDPGPPLGAVKGRWRFRPPSKVLSMPAAGIFLPATREVRAVIERTPGSAQVAAWVPGQTATAANGIIYGQYHAPIGEYLFPEQIVGNPVPPANFETMPFLAQGGYTSSAGTLAGQLFPWPGNPAPAGCAGPPPVAKAIGTPATVFSGSGTITLDASASTGSGLAFSWVQNPADVPQVTLTGANTAQASFTVPAVAATTTLSFTVTVSNAAGSSVAQVSVNVVVGAPIVNHVNPVSVPSGTPNVTLPISGVDSGGLPLTFSATQTGGSQPLLNVAVTSTGPGTANVSFSAPTLPLGQVQPDVVTLTITATNSAGATSLPEFTSVAVNPLADVITVTSAEYRTSKQRLLINVTDSVISSNVVLTLQPYLTTTGTIFDPSGLGNVFLNQGGGLYLLDIVGAPEPAIPPATPLDVKSNLKGDSGTFGLTRIRQ